MVSTINYSIQLNLALEAKFPNLIAAISPAEQVGNSALDEFSKVTHSLPMLSLANAFDMENDKGFIDQIENFLRSSSNSSSMLNPERGRNEEN